MCGGDLWLDNRTGRSSPIVFGASADRPLKLEP
jgi:hypothetical protein